MNCSVNYWLTACCLLTLAQATFAQSSGIPLHAPAYDLLRRLELKTGIPNPMHPELKPGFRADAAGYGKKLDTLLASRLSSGDRSDIQYLLLDNNEFLSDINPPRRSKGPRIFRNFYNSPAHFLS